MDTPMCSDHTDHRTHGHNLLCNDNYTDQGMFEPVADENVPHFVPILVLYGTTFVIGVIGNGLVVFALLGDRKHRNVTTSFMVSLACADLLFLLVCVPYQTCQEFIRDWSVGHVLCKGSGLAEMMSTVASIANLTAISIERYMVIVHPMRSRFFCTRGKTTVIVVVIWILAFSASLPTVFIMDLERFEVDAILNVTLDATLNSTMDGSVNSTLWDGMMSSATLCTETHISEEHHLYYTMYQFAIMFALPTLVMLFCYICVIWVLWSSTKQLDHMTALSKPTQAQLPTPRRHLIVKASDSGSITSSPIKRQNQEARETRTQVIKMLITVIIIFLLCWGPQLVLKIMKRQRLAILYFPASYTAKIIIGCLPYVQSCLNPIIYGFMSRNFRRSMRYSCRTHIFGSIVASTCLRSRQSPYEYELENKAFNGTMPTYTSTRTIKHK